MKKYLIALGNFLASPTGLFVHLALLIISFGALVYWNVLTFTRSGVEKKEYLTAQEFAQIHPAIQDKPGVEVGFSVDSFNEFNVEKNTFSALGVVWFIYDPQQVSLETLSEFSFLRGELIEKSAPSTHMHGNRRLSQFNVFVEFTSDLHYENFPLDDHRIRLVLKNNNLTSDNIQLVTSKKNMYLDPAVTKLNDWELKNYDAEVVYNEIVIKEEGSPEKFYAPYVVFSFDFNRLGIHFILLILFPLIFIFFVCLSVFLLRPDATLEAFETMLFALIGFLFILEAIAPSVGYLTLGDEIYFVIFIASFIPLILAWYGEGISRAIRGLIGTLIEISMIALIFYLVW